MVLIFHKIKSLSRLKGRSVLLTFRLKNRTCEARKTATAQREGPNKKYLKEYNLGDAFGPGYFGLAYARLLLRNEPSPAYPYRVFYFKYDLGDVFCLDFCCLFTLDDALDQ